MEEIINDNDCSLPEIEINANSYKVNKDARWQLVLGYKNRKWRVIDGIRKLEKVYAKNASDEIDPIQYANRNMHIETEIRRLGEVVDFMNSEIKRIITAIHKDYHK